MPVYNYDRYRVVETHEAEAWVQKATELRRSQILAARAVSVDAHELDLASMISLLYLFGMRPSEAMYMYGYDVWLQTAMVMGARDGVTTISEKLDPAWLFCKIPTHKNKKGAPHRTLKVRSEGVFVECVLDYVKARREQLLERDRDLARARLWPFSRSTYYNVFKTVDPDSSPYLCRHTRAFRMAEAGATSEELRDWFGWADTRPAAWYIQASGRLAQGLAERVRIV